MDPSPNAYGSVVERLLASLHYGERWGQHWLDVVRYADTDGFEYDALRPDAWRYRDYVVRSFNHDKPFDRFILEQLAGDELAPGDQDSLVAVGFNRLAAWRKKRAAAGRTGLDSQKRGRKADPAIADARREEALVRENKRLRHQLAQAHTIIDVQKKLCSLLGLSNQDESNGTS